MRQTGAQNALTDVAGILVGHHGDTRYLSGTTAIIAPEGAVAGVDVRGSAPGTRETDLLSPENLVERANAVVLCGGSVYGLAAADGVVRWLAERGWGFALEAGQVAPIVPAAALFDLGRGPEYVPPVDASWGRLAAEAAGQGTVSQGSVGAGTGAMSGGLKGGVGTASELLPTGLTVAALAAVNSLGSVLDPETGLAWEARLELAGELGPAGGRAVTPPGQAPGAPAANTTIAVVATDAALTKTQANKLAQMAQDGLARAVRPAHTMFDGDTVFALATGQRELPSQPGFFAAPQAAALTELGAAAADCLARAVTKGVLLASGLGGMPAHADLPDFA
jgi:L-aminopeptidase/D-esterase-like protein